MKKVNLFFLSLLLTATAVFTGCEQGNPSENSAIKVENNGTLTQNVFADETQGKSSVSFTTTGAWTSSITEGTTPPAKSAQLRASQEVSWISIDPSGGKEAGSYTISITLRPNTTSADRTAVITITCGGEKITITVTQKATKEDGTVPEEENPSTEDGSHLVSRIEITTGYENSDYTIGFDYGENQDPYPTKITYSPSGLIIHTNQGKPYITRESAIPNGGTEYIRYNRADDSPISGIISEYYMGDYLFATYNSDGGFIRNITASSIDGGIYSFTWSDYYTQVKTVNFTYGNGKYSYTRTFEYDSNVAANSTNLDLNYLFNIGTMPSNAYRIPEVGILPGTILHSKSYIVLVSKVTDSEGNITLYRYERISGNRIQKVFQKVNNNAETLYCTIYYK